MVCQMQCMEALSLKWEKAGSAQSFRPPLALLVSTHLEQLGFYVLGTESSGKNVLEQRILQLKILKITAPKEHTV